MKSPDPEVRGATYALLSNGATLLRIVPALASDEVFDCVLEYFSFCLREDPQGRWVHSRYSAGWDMVGWVAGLLSDPSNRSYLGRIEARLAELFRAGDVNLRRAIVDAVLEHLFEHRDLAKMFRPWRGDPVLRVAYDEAMMWVEGGGRTPLGPER